MKVIVADSSPLIALACSGHIDVLLSIVSQVLITETVFLECTADSGKPGASRIQKAVSGERITQVTDPEIGIFGGISGLDMGEALAISLAHAMRVPILVDDAVGRQVARAHGIPVMGSCGILLAAKQRGLIPAVAPVIEIWKQEIAYFLSATLIDEVLKRAGEKFDPMGRTDFPKTN